MWVASWVDYTSAPWKWSDSTRKSHRGGARRRSRQRIALSVVVRSRLASGGWAPVDRSTLRTGEDGAWTIGDVALFRMVNGMPLPKGRHLRHGAGGGRRARCGPNARTRRATAKGSGAGRCWFRAARGQASSVEERFLDPGEPVVEFRQRRASLRWKPNWPPGMIHVAVAVPTVRSAGGRSGGARVDQSGPAGDDRGTRGGRRSADGGKAR